MHDPTQKDMQFPDVGTQYRSEIFYIDENQKKTAEKIKNIYNKIHGGKVETNISEMKNYTKAEEYHQKYIFKKIVDETFSINRLVKKNLTKVRIIDGSWHMPDSNRNPLEEFKKNHIQNSVFFDLDKNSNQSSDLPHMLPEKTQWEKINSDFGISNEDHIIIYDNSDVISSCRFGSVLFFWS